MKKEKTLEELISENELLNHQISEINEKLKELGSVLIDAKERNVKLAYATRLFAETHLTKDEKLSIAKEFDRAISANHVEGIYNKYIEQICPPGVDVENDFMWSLGFIRDLEKYYFKYKGYNPFEIINNSIKIIRKQFTIEDDLKDSSDLEKNKLLKEAWKINREASLSSVDEILSITNEILKK